eukprot:TRINITY_DN11346_c0_g1_i1.p1 TRINITY_DN11346_c0_g1~~TRINITY_DN11346_c0_g1_i1.p1  ORF type:complete len:568 (-),score=174.36 TRINITY_DN11346_c0_g1_i1:155-1858(-)
METLRDEKGDETMEFAPKSMMDSEHRGDNHEKSLKTTDRLTFMKDFEARICAEYQLLSGKRDIRKGNYESAKEKIETSLEQVKFIDEEEESFSHSQLGEAYLNLKEFEKAIVHLEIALNFYRKKNFKRDSTTMGDNEKRVKILQNIAKIHQKTGNLETSSKYYKDAVEVFRCLSDDNCEALCLFQLGWNYFNLSKLNDSLANFHKSLEIRLRLGDGNGAGMCLMYIANCQLRLRFDSTEVLDHFEKASILLEKSRDFNSLAVCLNEVGKANYALRDFDSAIEFFMRSSSLFETLGHQDGMAQSFGGLALAEWSKGRLEQGIIYGRLSLDIYRKMGDDVSTSKTLDRLGSFYFAKGDIDTTIQYYEKAVDLSKSCQNYEVIATSSLELSKAYLEKDRVKEAKRALRRALKVFKYLAQQERVEETVLLLEQIERKEKNIPNPKARQRSVCMSMSPGNRLLVEAKSPSRTWSSSSMNSTGNGHGSLGSLVNRISGDHRDLQHSFKLHTFKTPTQCGQCNSVIWGLSSQDFQCEHCTYPVHKKCLYGVNAPCSQRLKSRSSHHLPPALFKE